MSLLIEIVSGDLAQVVASWGAGNVSDIESGGWGGILSSLLLTTLFLFLHPSLLVGGLSILGAR